MNKLEEGVLTYTDDSDLLNAVGEAFRLILCKRLRHDECIWVEIVLRGSDNEGLI